jgi:hypothetical protein
VGGGGGDDWGGAVGGAVGGGYAGSYAGSSGIAPACSRPLPAVVLSPTLLACLLPLDDARLAAKIGELVDRHQHGMSSRSSVFSTKTGKNWRALAPSKSSLMRAALLELLTKPNEEIEQLLEKWKDH